MRTKVILFALLFTCLFSSAATAQTFRAEVDKQAVAIGENFTLTYTLAGKGEKFRAPSLSDFRVLSGPSTSQSYSWINGKSSSQSSYSYILQAQRAGNFTIQPAYVDLNGNAFASNPITIRVGAASANVQFDGSTPKNAKNELEKNIYIKTALSKKTVYVGEPFVAFYRLYAHPSTQFDVTSDPKMPVFNSFWAQDLDKKAQTVFVSEYINGANYRRADFKKTILIPRQSGDFTLDPLEMNINARIQVKSKQKRNSNSPFADPFFSPDTFQDYTYTLKSEEAQVKVLPLPQNAPQSFNGGVGVYKAKFSIDRNELKQGEPITLRLEIEGSGNFPLLEAPSLKSGDGYEIYAPKSKDEYYPTEAGFEGKKTFEYIIVPKNVGQFEVPEFEFSFFNTALADYQSLKSEKYKINVEKSNGLSFNFTGEESNSPTLLNKIFIYVVLPGGLLVSFLIAWFFYKNKKREKKEESATGEVYENKSNEKPPKAQSQKEYLSSAKKFAMSGSAEEFALALSNAIWLFLSNKLSVGVSELKRESASERLKEKGVDETLIENLIKALDIAEYIRYSPNNAGKINLMEYAEETEKLLIEIEEKIV